MPTIVRVNEGHQVVIYRLGRYYCVAGPGPVFIVPLLEQIHEWLDVREDQRQVTVENVITNGVPVSVGLHYRARLAIGEVVDSFSRQAEIVSWEHWERERKLDDTARHVVIQVIKAYESDHPVADEADFPDKLAHIFPGSPANLDLLVQIRGHLASEMRGLGYLLAEDAPVWFVIEQLPQRLLDAFDAARADRVNYQRRRRIWQDMLTYIDHLPPALQAHMLSVAEQLQPPPVQVGGGDTTAVFKSATQPDVEIEIPVRGRPSPESPRSGPHPGADRNLRATDGGRCGRGERGTRPRSVGLQVAFLRFRVPGSEF